MDNKSYRPDIDGLRAIAVVSVLLNHLSANIMPGGFVGVDIFFVISGFLITSQIYKSLVAGNFTIREFYRRRINRILPALIGVVIFSILVGFAILTPDALLKLVASAFSSLIGVSNIYLWREYGNYFAEDSNEAILLHTWSLGVEEQFYMIWPLLLIVLVKIPQRMLLSMMIALTSGALIVSQYALGIAASASYFLLPMRFYELMVGACLAIGMSTFKQTNVHISNAFGAMGGVLIAYSLIYLDKSSPFPGINGMWPCLGAAFIILSGSNQASFVRTLLSAPPLVFIGLISYSLYLWHWPIIAYLNYAGIELSWGVVVAVFGLSTAMAWISWRFVETPFRQSGVSINFRRTAIRRLVVPVVLLGLVYLATWQTDGFPTRVDPAVIKLEAMALAKPNESRTGCHVPTAMYRQPPSEKCRLGVEKEELDGILIGDSYANHFTGMIDHIAAHDGLSIMDYSMDACPPLSGYITAKGESYASKCIARNEFIYSYIEKKKFKYIILAGAWPHGQTIGPLVHSSVDRLRKTGAKVVVILSNNQIARAVSCPVRQSILGGSSDCSTPRRAAPGYWDEIRVSFPDVRFIEPNDVMCTANTCSPIMDGRLLYRDNGHLNDVGSRYVGDALLRRGISLKADNDIGYMPAAPLVSSSVK